VRAELNTAAPCPIATHGCFLCVLSSRQADVSASCWFGWATRLLTATIYISTMACSLYTSTATLRSLCIVLQRLIALNQHHNAYSLYISTTTQSYSTQAVLTVSLQLHCNACGTAPAVRT
jgi:hypothetical protein